MYLPRTELRFFTDDGALVRATWDTDTDRAVSGFDVLTRWGWRRQRVTGQMIRTLSPHDAEEICRRQGVRPDDPVTVRRAD